VELQDAALYYFRLVTEKYFDNALVREVAVRIFGETAPGKAVQDSKEQEMEFQERWRSQMELGNELP